VGAAALAHVRLTGVHRRETAESRVSGPSSSTLDAFRILSSSSAKVSDYRGKEEERGSLHR